MRFPILFSHIDKDKFSLDSSGIAGFFGGEESFAAMNTVHLIPGRRWLGWYNSPGSYFVAKKYGMLPESTIWDGLFPGPTVTPTNLVELDAKAGLRYTGVHSGTQLDNSGHLSYLIARYCENKVKTRNITSRESMHRDGEKPASTSDLSLSLTPDYTSETAGNNMSPSDSRNTKIFLSR